MYRKIDDFITDWKSEREFTIKVFSHITDEIKSNKSNENIRTLERLAWHITQTLSEMPFKAGLFERDLLENNPIPTNIDEIVEIYKKQSAELSKVIQKEWSFVLCDEFGASQ